MKSRTKEKDRIPQWLPPTLLALGFFAVAANQVRVQFAGRSAILHKAQSVNRLFAEKSVPAERGEIRDADGHVLARSTDHRRLGMNPKAVPIAPSFWAKISHSAGISAAEFMDYANRQEAGNDWDMVLKSAEAAELNDVRSSYLVDGVWLRAAESREYPYGQYFSTLLGYVGQKGAGEAGLERSQNERLQGVDGKIKGLTDGSGNFLPWLVQDESTRKATPGKEIVLTVHADMQVMLEKSLTAQCVKHRAKNGAALILDPKTGDILAIASWPLYDPANPGEAQFKTATSGSTSPQFNPVFSMRFEPGSTFKAFTLAMGYETGLLDDNTHVFCVGEHRVANKVIHCSGDHGSRAHGDITPAKCMEVSCNVAASKWGMKLGYERYKELFKNLGIMERQDIGVGPETPGYYKESDPNKTLQTANLAFGQSMAVSPVGLASAFTVFANHGVRVMPRLIKSIGGVEQPIRIGKQVFSRESSDKILSLMQAVVQGKNGTGKKLKIPGYILAGKTGTAQKLGSGSRPGMHVSSFVGYVPAVNPRALVLVMIDEPTQKGFYGGIVAGPVYQDAAKYLLRYYKCPPNSEAAIEAN